MAEPVVEAVAELLGEPALNSHCLSGSVYEVRLAGDNRVVAKLLGSATEVRAEAASLAWLAEVDLIRVPRVRASNNRWLITDFIAPGPATAAAAEELGRGLAALHASGAPGYGSPPPEGPIKATIGLAKMHNVESPTWAEFYVRQRIEPYLRSAVEQGCFASPEVRIFEQVISGIDQLAGPPEPPARLHGDLWSGNVHWGADGHAWLIDPAAHGGHRETDLAMLRLFGCPHLERLVAAHCEQVPLADGWQARIALHQLFPLLVHTVLFGGSYAGQAVQAARAALRS